MKLNSVVKAFFSITICSLFLCPTLKAQQDSTNLKQITGKAITERFPSTRFVNVVYEYVTPLDYKTKLYKKPFENGRLENQNRIIVDVNLPIYKTKKWVFTGSFGYIYTHSDLGDQENVSSDYKNLSLDRSTNAQTFNFALNSTYITRVLNKPLVTNFRIAGEASQDGFERMNGMIISTFLFKKTHNLSMTGGAVVIVDKMMRWPLLPVFGLEYKFANTWAVSMALPQYAYIRKSFSNNARLSLGSSLDSQRYYVHSDEYKKTLLYNKVEIKSGFLYEYYIQKHFILNLRAGMLNALQGRLIPKNESSSKYIMTSTQKASIYFNIGLSYNLF